MLYTSSAKWWWVLVVIDGKINISQTYNNNNPNLKIQTCCYILELTWTKHCSLTDSFLYKVGPRVQFDITLASFWAWGKGFLNPPNKNHPWLATEVLPALLVIVARSETYKNIQDKELIFCLEFYFGGAKGNGAFVVTSTQNHRIILI